jgi:nitroreductase
METIKAIARRKSTRKYLDRQIAEKELETILFAGCDAPVAGNDWHTMQLVVIQNKELLSRISEAGSRGRKRRRDPLYGAPTLVLIASEIYCPYPFHAGQQNAACIGENMCIAAADLGLGSTYLTGFLPGFNADAELVKDAGVREGFKTEAAIALGYPEVPDDSEKQMAHQEIITFIR